MITILKQFNITPERATEIGEKLAAMPDFIEVHPERILNHLVTALGLTAENEIALMRSVVNNSFSIN